MSSLRFALLRILAGAGIVLGSSESPFLPAVEILVSFSSTATLYSCFVEKIDEANTVTVKEACCNGVAQAWDKTGEKDANHETNDRTIHQSCLSEIAQVPPSTLSITSPSGNPEDTAKFVWIVSASNQNLDDSRIPLKQYITAIGSDGSSGEYQPVQTITPYHKIAFPSPETSDDSYITLPLGSSLDPMGGMHRLFQHEFLISAYPGQKYFLYITIPKGMFIDLDDPLETSGSFQFTPTKIVGDIYGAAKQRNNAFVITNYGLSFRMQLHAAIVCDIEQPSFVSGQHLLVWEIDNVTLGYKDPEYSELFVVVFSTKLHLRYPHPSSTMEEWIDLPMPLYVASGPNLPSLSDLRQSSHPKGYLGWRIGIIRDRVWVAAGKEEDHDWIMGLTIVFCCIGVAMMLRDISSVSQWDNV